MAVAVNRRSFMLVASLGLAGVATAAFVSFMHGVQARALAGAEPVEVLVARETIPAGTSGAGAISAGLIEGKTVPRGALPEGVVASADDVRDKTVLSTVYKGEPLLAARFGSGSTAVLPIPADRQAMTVEVGVPPGVGGFIQPGDHVSILAQLDVPRTPGADPLPRVQYLLQDVSVLSVGRRVVSDQEKDAEVDQEQKVLLTLALLPAEAEKLTFAVLQGQVYATLLAPGAKPVSTTGRTRDNAFS